MSTLARNTWLAAELGLKADTWQLLQRTGNIFDENTFARSPNDWRPQAGQWYMRWLTFDVRGLPKAGPLDGGVRRRFVEHSLLLAIAAKPTAFLILDALGKVASRQQLIEDDRHANVRSNGATTKG
jgi:hypothetical protein